MKKNVRVLFLLIISCFSVAAGAETALQNHVRFFDEDGDGLISMAETYNGFRKLGLGVLESSKAAAFINGILGPKTHESIWNLFSVNISNIHLGIHDSDTGAYDETGNFREAKLRKIFDAYDVNKDDALSLAELSCMHQGRYESLSGNRASIGEFNLLLRIAGEPREIDGKTVSVLTFATLVDFYTGDLLWRVADKVAAAKKDPEKNPDL